MPTVDAQPLRSLLARLLPGLKIEAVANPSGQRVVYFAKFEEPASSKFLAWGNVVVKVSEQLHPKQIAYLQKEIQLLNSLKTNYYPRLYYNDVFTHDPDTEDPLKFRLFVSIEERIKALPLNSCRAMFATESKVIQLLLGLIDGLDLLWSRQEKLVHRDLKPENILIRPDESVAIIDLGIVREEGTVGLTEDNAIYGPCSPPYASPEQAANDKKSISFKSDFFALGTNAYELITGKNPYFCNGDSREDVLEKVKCLVPTPLYQLKKSSKAFSDILETVMKKHPYERYRTVSRFREALQRVGDKVNGS